MADNPLLIRIDAELAESCRVKQSFSRQLKMQIIQLAEQMAGTLAAGGTIFWMGNGGSAADAQHLVAELVGKLRRPRKALPAVSLTTNTSILTAVANDTDFEEVFARQVEALVRPGDLLIGLSTSGNSENVLRALRAGKKKKVFTVGWTGRTGGRLAKVADLCLRVPSTETQRIQEAHITIGHIVCGIVEDLLETKAQLEV